ncbi:MULTISPECIES: H-NS family nucleoid-associated regulatory protein [unclassified Massilia]|uniref:H-NS histone family protein n=1 Tax=unclassified Massilia TaxID=2609279 RepID=UPI0009E66565|nr:MULTISPECIES: H-NS histone family protein [unclassified Massilia]
MPTYQEYQEQIAKLQALAETARKDEIEEARRQVRELMQQHNLSATDLAESTKKSGNPSKKPGTVEAKYRDPASGQTWTGRGRAPRWLDGKNREDFLIK